MKMLNMGCEFKIFYCYHNGLHLGSFPRHDNASCAISCTAALDGYFPPSRESQGVIQEK